MRELVAIAKALSDESRVRILTALDGRELCVCHLVELVELAPSTVSKHMSVLRQAGLVDRRKDGRWAYYRTAAQQCPAVVREALDWVLRAVQTQQWVEEDRKRLATILACNQGDALEDAARLTCCDK